MLNDLKWRLKVLLRPYCWANGHRRGHVVEIDEAAKTRTTECPRCRRRLTRKVKK